MSMPTSKAPTNIKPEKKNQKEILLELINSQYGPTSSMIMEKAFKTQDKQIDEAMQQGMSADDIAKTQGIDLSRIKVSKPASEMGEATATTTQPAPEQGKQALGQLIQSKPASSPFGFGGMSEQGGQLTEQKPGLLAGLLSMVMTGRPNTSAMMDLKKLTGAANLQGSTGEARESLIAQRKANTALMQRQLEGGDVTKVYRDPVTGEEVSPEQAQADMEAGLGVYQVNQRIASRGGIVEKPLNKVPDLTQEEKKYVNDARLMNTSLTNLETGFDSLYNKFGDVSWKAFQIERMPYYLAQDQDVQGLKSELVYLKAAIPFMRGGKQLTKEEGKRVDVMLNPFGKTKATYKKDIQRFQKEFMGGSDIMKFGVNASLMRRLIDTHKEKQKKQMDDISAMSDEELKAIIGGGQ